MTAGEIVCDGKVSGKRRGEDDDMVIARLEAGLFFVNDKVAPTPAGWLEWLQSFPMSCRPTGRARACARFR